MSFVARSSNPFRLALLLAVVWGAGGLRPEGAHAQLSPAFTYQGQLQQSGMPENATCDFQFGLFAATSGGTALGTQAVNSVSVTNGLFTVVLNASNQLGVNAFSGSTRYLEVDVCCPTGCAPSYVTLSPRQQLTATPYSLFAPTAGVANDVSFNYAASSTKGGAAANLSCSGCVTTGDLASGAVTSSVLSSNAVGSAQISNGSVTAAKVAVPLDLAGSNGTDIISGTNAGAGAAMSGVNTGTGPGGLFRYTSSTGTAAAVEGDSASTSNEAVAVLGKITSTSPGAGSAAVQGSNSGTGSLGIGVVGTQAGSGDGVWGSAPSGVGVYGQSSTGSGVFGSSSTGSAGLFQRTSTTGTAAAVEGDSASTEGGAVAVLGKIASSSTDSDTIAVRGSNSGTSPLGIGVEGDQAGSGWGVYGYAPAGWGVYGYALGGAGVVGGSDTGIAGAFYIANAGNTQPALSAFTVGTGPAGLFHHTSTTGTSAAVEGDSNSTDPSAVAVLGQITSTSPGKFSAAVQGVNNGTGVDGIGVAGSQAGSGWGVYGKSANGFGVRAESGGSGLYGAALRANNTNASGIGIWSTTGSSDSNVVLTNTGSGDLIRGFSGGSGGNLVFQVLNNGDTIVHTLTQTSSRRYKQNIKPMDHALDKVSRLQAVRFDWDAAHGGGHDIGFIAEDVGKVVPEIVSYEKDGRNAVGMKYDRIGALTVEAIKEQQKQIHSLSDENAELKTQLAALAAEVKEMKAKVRVAGK